MTEKKKEEKYDPINKPRNYNQGGIEVFDFIKSNNFNYAQGNVVKYVSRYRHKGTPVQDLLKARWYLNKLIEETASLIQQQKQQQEAEIKKMLMEQEFQYNIQLQGIESEGQKSKETEKEDRKDKRTKIQASQQSELIDQRLNKKPPKKFESSGNDIMSGEFGLGEFGPK